MPEPHDDWRHAMFEKLDTPEEIFSFKLGAALSMENTVLDSLQEMQEETNRDEIRTLLVRHEAETRQHIANIEKAFELLGEQVDDSPCPAMQGIAKEGKATLKKIDDSIADAGILSGAIETEHHEIAVYEILVTNAKARGAIEVAALMQENLDSEQNTLDAVKSLAERIATGEGYAVATA
jgi:ferritin-like metal-binding protein YciE